MYENIRFYRVAENFNAYKGLLLMKKLPVLFVICCLAAMLAGCAVENNYLAPDDFADCLRRNDIVVDSVRPLAPDPFRATSACAVKIGDSEIGVYKYDLSSKVQQKRIERISQSRKVYIIGLPYYAYVHGSFVFVGLDKHKQKHAIIKAIKRFK